jgi:pyruvate formate lyase activating enzyme
MMVMMDTATRSAMLPASAPAAAAPAGVVFDVKRGSADDGPGIRTTVFLKGCPLRCAWCHNPEGLGPRPVLSVTPGRCVASGGGAGCGACAEACPEGAIRWSEDGAPVTDRHRCAACGRCVEACPSGARELLGAAWSSAALVDEVARDRPFFDASGGGVTFSGGEPLAQPAFLLDCLRACRDAGLHTALDTSGYAPPDVALAAAAAADLVLFDLKHPDPVRHERFTGVPLRAIVHNLRALDAAGARLWLRVPVIPGINDDADARSGFVALLGTLRRSYPVWLLPYHETAAAKYARLGRAYGFTAPAARPAEGASALAAALRAAGHDVEIGGEARA